MSIEQNKDKITRSAVGWKGGQGDGKPVNMPIVKAQSPSIL